MTIYTVLPYFSNPDDGVFFNDVKSFTDYDEAYHYATSYCSGKTFDIIENQLD
jgi:hypothetical protein